MYECAYLYVVIRFLTSFCIQKEFFITGAKLGGTVPEAKHAPPEGPVRLLTFLYQLATVTPETLIFRAL